MTQNISLLTPSMIFDVSSMGVRLIPRGQQRVFRNGKDLYRIFQIFYADAHPGISYEEFLTVMRDIFPVYKNPRKQTEEFKITTHDLRNRLSSKWGMTNFPFQELYSSERLKIEL